MVTEIAERLNLQLSVDRELITKKRFQMLSA